MRTRSSRGPRALALAAAVVAVCAVVDARADDAPPVPDEKAPPSLAPTTTSGSVVVWPTLTPAGDDVGGVAIHKPTVTEGGVYTRAQELEATLRDAVQDLGYTLDVADSGPAMGRTRDLDMIERARRSSARGAEADPGTWVVSARLEPQSNDTYILRIVVAPPRSKQLRVRVERVNGADVSVRGLVLLRDLLSSTPAARIETGPRPQESASSGIMGSLRSQGRAVLAVNAALFGAFTAFSIQRASGSEDPRLLYPLLTLGTGLGLGSALLVAEEWDVTTGDAWTLAGGAWWGTTAGILIANGRHVQPLSDRYAWGVGGGLVGLGLATFSLTRHKADEGDAALVHSGAGVGLGLGALADFFYHGDLERTPYTGAGYGAGIGLLTAGTFATFVQVSPSRVVLVDIGAGLGAAAGAAVGSPLLFGDVTEGKTRGFVAATGAGTVVGAAAALWFTRDRRHAVTKADAPRIVPFGGVVGASATPEGSVPAYGIGARGTW